MKLEDLPDQQLIGCFYSRRSKANDLEAEMYALRDEADEIAGMLEARGYRRVGDEWVKRPD
jgi:hypothetical protein